MPYKIIHIKGSTKVKVVNKETGKVKAKKTTMKKARAQIRLLGMLEHRKEG